MDGAISGEAFAVGCLMATVFLGGFIAAMLAMAFSRLIRGDKAIAD